MLRRHAALALSVVLAVALTACGPQQSTTTDASSVIASASSTTAIAVEKCWDIRELSHRRLAELHIMPGVSGRRTSLPRRIVGTDSSVPGVIVMTGETGLRKGVFRDMAHRRLPGLVAIDYEGGSVARHAETIGPMPSARVQAQTMTPDDVRQLSQRRGKAMRALGVNVNFAPVADLDLGSPVIADRSYSADPARTIAYAAAYADGMRQAGVLPVLKHFPGHGSASGDSHVEAVTTDHWSRLKERDVQVFRQLLARSDRWGLMVGHMQVPGLSSAGTPTSLNPQIYRYIRRELGFTGLIFTDDLSRMKGVTNSARPAKAVVRAMEAGADIALMNYTENYRASLGALTAWSKSSPSNRQLLEESGVRILAHSANGAFC